MTNPFSLESACRQAAANAWSFSRDYVVFSDTSGNYRSERRSSFTDGKPPRGGVVATPGDTWEDVERRYLAENAPTAKTKKSRGSATKSAQLTTAEHEALAHWARSHGRKWKEALRHAWESGDYRPYTEYDDVLQRLRNSRGPRWLTSFKTPKSFSSR